MCVLMCSIGYNNKTQTKSCRQADCFVRMLYICDCGEQTHIMDHLLKCHMLPQECTTEDLMEYNETAKECVFQWMNNV